MSSVRIILSRTSTLLYNICTLWQLSQVVLHVRSRVCKFMYEVCDNWKQISVGHADSRSGPPPASVGAAGGAARAPVPACLADPRARLTLHYSAWTARSHSCREPFQRTGRTRALNIRTPTCNDKPWQWTFTSPVYWINSFSVLNVSLL